MLALENMKVVIGRVASRVTFSSNGGAEDDEVFGQRGVNNVHGSHGTTGIVPNPLVTVSELGLDLGVGVSLLGTGQKLGDGVSDVEFLVRDAVQLRLRGQGFLEDGIEAFRAKVVKRGLS